jgi:acyl carrier protein
MEGINTMATTFERVRDITVELLGQDAEKVTAEARFREDLEADSLDLVELIMAFEEEFGGEISDEDAQKITTVGEAVEYIETRMRANNN